MLPPSPQGRVLGHLCGIVGTTIAIDWIIGKFDPLYPRIFPYRDSAALIAAFLIALGARVVSENLPRRIRGPWRR